jgi:hypothetical protein
VTAAAGAVAGVVLAVVSGLAFGFASVAFVSMAGLASAVGAGVAVTLSILKSAAVGGGTFAGSGRGIAASIANSAALPGAGGVCANAVGVDAAKNVAATAISTQSNPVRPVE